MASNLHIDTTSHALDLRPRYPFTISAKRYTPRQRPISTSDGYVFIFAHGTGFHKEHWEPVFERLVEIDNGRGWVKEAWSIDAPNHGDASVLNEELLDSAGEPVSFFEIPSIYLLFMVIR
jgi:hypothetical protein